MSDIATADSAGGSPFDAIRRVDAKGEHWMARDLMVATDYTRWQNFEAAIKRAQQAVINSKGPANQFAQVRQVTDAGNLGEQSRVDYRLTRYAAYLVVMNGDPTKTAIAEAQAYFAQKTREAETAVPFDPASLSRLDILKMAMQAEEEKAVLEAALESAAPAIAYHDRFVARDDAVLVRDFAQQFGSTDPKVRELLVEHRLAYRFSIGERWSTSEQRKVEEFEWRARAGRYQHWFDLRPQHNIGRHHNGQVRQTLYIRQEFVIDVAKRIGLVQPPLPGSEVATREAGEQA